MSTSVRVLKIVLIAVIAAMTFSFLETLFFKTDGASKMQKLRKGEVVQIEAGRKGRLHLKDKTFETSDGRQIYVGDDPDFFPSSFEELSVIEMRESFQSNHPLTYKMESFYEDNLWYIWLTFGSIAAIYAAWRLLKFLIRQVFFTATKAIEDAKKDL